MKNLRILAVVIVFLWSYATLAEQYLGLKLPLSETEQIEVRTFTHQYRDIKSVIAALLDEPVILASENALAMYDALVKCDVTYADKKIFVSISGEACKIKYTFESKTDFLGLNENGDPIYETKRTIDFAAIDAVFAQQVGLTSFRAHYSDRSETLVSTPVEVVTLVEHIHFLTAQGKEIETDERSRFYTNIELHENTLFREQAFNFKNFMVTLDLRIETTFEGDVKAFFVRLNNSKVDLKSAVDLLTTEFVGVLPSGSENNEIDTIK